MSSVKCLFYLSLNVLISYLGHCSALWNITPFTGASQYKDACLTSIGFPYKDKMLLWLSYLYNGNTHTCIDGLYINSLEPSDAYMCQ